VPIDSFLGLTSRDFKCRGCRVFFFKIENFTWMQPFIIIIIIIIILFAQAPKYSSAQQKL